MTEEREEEKKGRGRKKEEKGEKEGCEIWGRRREGKEGEEEGGGLERGRFA